MYSKTDIKGMHCAVLRRNSSRSQGTSIKKIQGRTVDSVIDQYDLHVVKEYKLEAVTGSIPGNRTDIDDVIELREQLGLKSLLLLVPDHTRFTRAGAGHGGHLLYRLRTNGIFVFFVAEDLLVDSDLTLQMALMLLSAAHQTAKSIARSSTIGSDVSFLEGKSPYTRKPPFGLDRKYFVNGNPLHIIRNLPDGTQEMLDPDTHEVIRRFGKNPTRGVPAHYIKQKDETVSLCLGAPEALATLFLLFEMRYAQQMNYRQIALRLNSEQVPSPTGVEWTAGVVHNILLNPIYVGLAVRYRKTGSVYVMGGSPNGEPEPSEVTPEELDKNRRVKVRRRTRDKWREQNEEQFKDLLPENVRDAARAAILAYLDATADGKPLKTYNRDKHTASLYFLKQIMTCKTTGLPMTGRLSGKKGKQVRKYGVSKGAHIPRPHSDLGKLVRAEPIEQSVMDLIRTVIYDRPGMVQAMRSALVKAKQQEKAAPSDVEDMHRQIKRLRKRIAVLSDQIGEDDGDDDPIVRKIEQAKQEITKLNVAIRQTGQAPTSKGHDPEQAIQQLADELQDFGRKINPDDIPLITAIAELLISRLTVDRDTKEFELELAIPSWFAQALQHPLPAGLVSLTACKPRHEAHPENAEILGTFHCDAAGRSVCYTCQRRAA